MYLGLVGFIAPTLERLCGPELPEKFGHFLMKLWMTGPTKMSHGLGMLDLMEI